MPQLFLYLTTITIIIFYRKDASDILKFNKSTRKDLQRLKILTLEQFFNLQETTMNKRIPHNEEHFPFRHTDSYWVKSDAQIEQLFISQLEETFIPQYDKNGPLYCNCTK